MIHSGRDMGVDLDLGGVGVNMIKRNYIKFLKINKEIMRSLIKPSTP